MNEQNEAIVKSVETEQEKAWALMQRQAQCWASSDLVPPTYKNKVANVVIAMEVARQIGVPILTVMQHLYVVHNKPAFEAKFLIAAANSSGKFSPLRYRFEGEEGDLSWGCRTVATDINSEEELVGPLVSMKTVQDEGWTRNPKWETMPELMLRYRAATWWVRVYAPEISMGFQTADEVVDVGQAQVVEVEPGESSLDAVTRELKAKQEEKKAKPPTRVDYMWTLYKRRYGDKAEDVVKEALTARERMLEDLDEDLAQEMIDEIEGPE